MNEMTNEEKVQGNKKIAGFIRSAEAPYSNDGDFIDSHYCNDNSCEAVYFSWEDMKFSTSWDWLMPVIIKMEVMGYGISSDPWSLEAIEYVTGREASITKYEIDREEKKITAWYNVVVEIITWYNTQSSDQR